MTSDIRLTSEIHVSLEDSMGDDRSVVQAARVSVKGANDIFDMEKDAGLINFLMKNRHGTPFEHNALKFLVKGPIFMFREWQRHRIFSYNERSGRYSEMEPIFYIPASDRNLKQEGKPGHYIFKPGTEQEYMMMMSEFGRAASEDWARYQRCLQAGIAKEVARMYLPLSLYSEMYATCNARSLMHFLSLRTARPEHYVPRDPVFGDAQESPPIYPPATFPSFPMREIEIAAEKMEDEFALLFPVTYNAFCENGRVCP